MQRGPESTQLWRPGLGAKNTEKSPRSGGWRRAGAGSGSPGGDPQGRSQFLLRSHSSLSGSLPYARVEFSEYALTLHSGPGQSVQAVRTGHLWAYWILGFLCHTNARGFSASFFSNIAMLPTSLVTFSRSRQRCMLPPSLIVSLLHFYLSVIIFQKIVLAVSSVH